MSEKKPKNHFLSQEKLHEFKERIYKGEIVNPHKVGGLYWNFVQALIELGANKKHGFLDVKDKMEELMGTEKWEKFAGKEARSEIHGKDVNGRIIQNASVLQRVNGNHPYGKKLQQLGMCIDIYRGTDDLPIYELRTNLVNTCQPFNAWGQTAISLDSETNTNGTTSVDTIEQVVEI